ncbi:hypothetical protein [Phytomonospora endophytica]|uniref:Uncharacterized protein n=1 Tax=Phytomonospora endophytica TaxID=714109 RepID=A0A841FPC1_9ACTN|nr:hypothetical protein [Phytomonospora endophytica]MBB6037955.1 hypothetical protein [Phytomonospora endophytica]GIG68855.1 hypothetical protein Pen01_51500 [Phytomonospora endophytica]
MDTIITAPPPPASPSAPPRAGRYASAAWRLLTALVFAAVGATLPTAAFLVHMRGTGAITGSGEPDMFAIGFYFPEWHVRQGVLITACLGLASWAVMGAVDRIRFARNDAPMPAPVFRGLPAALALGAAGLVLAAGAVVPAEAYRYYLRAHGPEYTSTSAYVFSDEGLGWALWDGVLAAACLWAGALLIRAAVRCRRRAR